MSDLPGLSHFLYKMVVLHHMGYTSSNIGGNYAAFSKFTIYYNSLLKHIMAPYQLREGVR